MPLRRLHARQRTRLRGARGAASGRAGCRSLPALPETARRAGIPGRADRRAHAARRRPYAVAQAAPALSRPRAQMSDAVAPAADLAHFAALDARLLQAVRGIRVLSAVSWPASRERKFLDALAGGRETVPKIEYARRDLSEQRAELEKVAKEADASHPIGDYLRRSACSWGVAAQMLEAVGTDRVTAHSIELYGRPRDALPGGGQTNLDAAHYFLPIAEKLGDGLAADTDDDENIPAQALCGELQREVDTFFGAGVVRVELDDDLTAKAAAGASRIRLRASTAFSAYDRSQLLAHEAFIHTLTALNGGAQPVLKSL